MEQHHLSVETFALYGLDEHPCLEICFDDVQVAAHDSVYLQGLLEGTDDVDVPSDVCGDQLSKPMGRLQHDDRETVSEN